MSKNSIHISISYQSASKSHECAQVRSYPRSRARTHTGTHHVSYDDGDKIWYDLREEKKLKRLKWVGQKPAKASRKRRVVEQDGGDDGGCRKSQSDDGYTESVTESVQSGTPSAATDSLLSREKTRQYKRIRSLDASSDSDSQTEKHRNKTGRRDSPSGGGSDDVICLEDEDEEESPRVRPPFSSAREGYFGDFDDRVNLTAKPMAMTKQVLHFCVYVRAQLRARGNGGGVRLYM